MAAGAPRAAQRGDELLVALAEDVRELHCLEPGLPPHDRVEGEAARLRDEKVLKTL